MTLPALYENIVGGLGIGFGIYAITLGVLTVQVGFYFHKHKDDRIWLKLAVAALFLLDLLQLFVLSHSVYRHVYTHWGNQELVVAVDWEVAFFQVGIIFASTVTQLFLALRLYRLSKSLIPSLIAIVLIVAHFGLGVLIQIRANQTTSFIRIVQKDRPLVATWFAIAAATDTFIAFAMVYCLRKRRTGFRKTDRVLTTMTLYSVNTGLLTSLAAIVGCIGFAVYGFHFVVMATIVPFAGFYSLTLMSNILARDTFRKKLISASEAQTQTHALPMQSMPQQQITTKGTILILSGDGSDEGDTFDIVSLGAPLSRNAPPSIMSNSSGQRLIKRVPPPQIFVKRDAAGNVIDEEGQGTPKLADYDLWPDSPHSAYSPRSPWSPSAPLVNRAHAYPEHIDPTLGVSTSSSVGPGSLDRSEGITISSPRPLAVSRLSGGATVTFAPSTSDASPKSRAAPLPSQPLSSFASPQALHQQPAPVRRGSLERPPRSPLRLSTQLNAQSLASAALSAGSSALTESCASTPGTPKTFYSAVGGASPIVATPVDASWDRRQSTVSNLSTSTRSSVAPTPQRAPGSGLSANIPPAGNGAPKRVNRVPVPTIPIPPVPSMPSSTRSRSSSTATSSPVLERGEFDRGRRLAQSGPSTPGAHEGSSKRDSSIFSPDRWKSIAEDSPVEDLTIPPGSAF